jgi:hypothetical protein
MKNKVEMIRAAHHYLDSLREYGFARDNDTFADISLSVQVYCNNQKERFALIDIRTFETYTTDYIFDAAWMLAQQVA